jgi:tRNA modification GTPase
MADTIYALSTGIGRAGVAIVRVSGPAVLDVLRLMVGTGIQPRTARVGSIKHPLTNEVLDYGLVLLFAEPASYTGEDVAEFHIHGGRAVIAAVLDALSLLENVRAAEPGEFTRRAFANGKLDLSSIEGLADLIAADTELQRRYAIRHFSGTGSETALAWRKSLVEVQALIEAYLDFPDESEIPVDVIDEVRGEISALISLFESHLVSRNQAEIVRDGFVVLIAGPPNSGKSSLLNRIASREVAMISEIPGTTRDLIEITIDLRGIAFTFVDSAGLRETTDPIEVQGIARTRSRAEHAHFVLWLSPANEPFVQPELVHDRLLVVFTKQDLAHPEAGVRSISSLTGAGIAELLDLIYETLAPSLDEAKPLAFANRRQYECVEFSLAALRRSLEPLSRHNLELVAEELRQASMRLQEITGIITNEHLLDEVFARFCLGK